MRTLALMPLLLALAAATAAMAQPPSPPPAKPAPAPAPGEIVAAAPAGDWVDIAPDDLLVMTLAPDAKARARRVVIQLMPPPFSQGWIANIRTLARAHWWDGTAVYRVQDNYVSQWGDAEGDDAARAKPLPGGLRTVPESDYVTQIAPEALDARPGTVDPYAPRNGFVRGWPVAADATGKAWPTHCYGMVGVARDMSPNTGTGSELYTVIGHAPRHLDRNIALVGRVIEGMEHLSSLPRGPGALGFYDKIEDRTPIRTARLASELPLAERPRLQYLSTDSESFERYAQARESRRDPFFIVPAGGADLCNLPVPIRTKP